MVAVITRVREASVRVGDELSGEIGVGLLVLLGVARADRAEEAEYLAKKIAGLRIFEDEAGKMGRSVSEAGGAILVVPNFTLTADCRKGRRPDFTAAAAPAVAEPLFEQFKDACRREGIPVQTGIFGADMAVRSINDGPVTLWMDTVKLMPEKREGTI